MAKASAVANGCDKLLPGKQYFFSKSISLIFIIIISLIASVVFTEIPYQKRLDRSIHRTEKDTLSSIKNPFFHDVSHLILNNSRELRYGVCATDIDGDQEFEFFVCGFGNKNLVLKWRNEKLEDIAVENLEVVADSSRYAIGAAAGDIDRDGREEIYVLNTDTFMGRKKYGDRLFSSAKSRHGEEVWEDLFSLAQNAEVGNPCAGRSVCSLDRNGSGAYSFFVSNYGCTMRLYEHYGELEGIVDAAKEANVAFGPSGGRSCLPGPIVSSAATDIFVGNENGPNFLFVNNGKGQFEEQAQEYGIHDPYEAARGVAFSTGDDFGIVVGNWEGQHRHFVMKHNSSLPITAEQPSSGHTSADFEDVASSEFSRPTRVRTVISADFDNDGVEEVFFNNIGEQNRLLCKREFAEGFDECNIGAAAEVDGFGTGASVADIDHDGFLELLVSHGESVAQPLSLYRTNKNDNSWLRVRPLTEFGAPARGAVVDLSGEGIKHQRRVIDGGSGYLCCMEPVAHFGLGIVPPELQLNVKVTWPSGLFKLLTRVKGCQDIIVEYPSTRMN